MSDFAAQPDEAVDRWLTDQRCTVVDDLVATLDLEADLREVMIPAWHADLVADLRGILDLEAGVSTIVPATSADYCVCKPHLATRHANPTNSRPHPRSRSRP